MSEVAIEVTELRKEFMLSHSGSASLKTALLWWRKRNLEQLNVLKGVSFKVDRGECVAIVGRNGAGKSTLLSLIARVYKPTSGSFKLHGKLAPLLELGAGFHPDLTGQENVMFNAMILGLSRKEANARTQSILDFAELDKYKDAPIRTYSSGMQARLGFSIATHVDATILIVDEVLAVGDFAFEQKCYQFLEEFKAKGGAVLFVSHDADSIKKVADRAIWLRDGDIIMDGPAAQVVDAYESDGLPGP